MTFDLLLKNNLACISTEECNLSGEIPTEIESLVNLRTLALCKKMCLVMDRASIVR